VCPCVRAACVLVFDVGDPVDAPSRAGQAVASWTGLGALDERSTVKTYASECWGGSASAARPGTAMRKRSPRSCVTVHSGLLRVPAQIGQRRT
jgi:hypothetical protein